MLIVRVKEQAGKLVMLIERVREQPAELVLVYGWPRSHGYGVEKRCESLQVQVLELCGMGLKEGVGK